MKTGTDLKLCTRCVLPETFPGIKFDDEGVCNYCHSALLEEKLAAQREVARGKFEQLLQELRGRGTYDVLVGWSGGKDSTYILARLIKEFNLRILAFTFDNGFVSKQAFRNMEKLSDSLGVDHIIYKARFDMMRPCSTLRPRATRFTRCRRWGGRATSARLAWGWPRAWPSEYASRRTSR